jgi:peptide/nickel transport system substrate-binding protein
MKNKNLLMIMAIGCLLLTSSFAVPAFAMQPEIKTDTYWVGTIGQPRRVDPARAYDTASGEFIMNVYEPLIFFTSKVVMPNYTASVPSIGMSNLSQFGPVLATAMPVIYTNVTTNITSWTFEINTAIDWQPWKDHLGTVYNQKVRVTDVEYTFKRMLVIDQIGAPSWMIGLPFTGHMFYNEIDGNTATNTLEPVNAPGNLTKGEELAKTLIETAIQVVDLTHIKFNMLANKRWPDVALYQIFAQTWGCIVNKDFCIEHGCWDGLFTPGWSTRYRQKPSNSYSPLDSYYYVNATLGSKYTAGDHDVPAMCGTGPYCSRLVGSTYGNKVDWDKTILKWTADAWDPGYRGGWNPIGTDKHSIRHIVVQGCAEWSTRKMMFLAGDTDSVAVPRANMWDLLEGSDPTGHTALAGIYLYYDAPALSNDVASFVFHLDPTTPYPPKIGGVTNLDFFNDVHIRRAFVRTLNFTTYLRDAWWGEAIQPASWWVEGLEPAAAKNTSLVPHSLDLTAVQTEFTLANVWDVGFEVTICYNLGNDQRKIACEMMRDAIQSLNALRLGKSPFVVHVVGLDWPVFLDYEEYMYMPMFFVGWLADFAHPDNFARPYMHTYGDFSYYQGYSDTHVDDLIDGAIIEPDPAKSILMYQELQYIYWRDNPGLPLIQAVGRRWQRDWVRGWYYNELYPGLFFYDLFKTVEIPAKPVDVSAVGSISPVGGRKLKVTPKGWLMTNLLVTMTIHRLDDGEVASFYVIMALNRTDVATGYSVIIARCDVMVSLHKGESHTEVFLWNESTLAGKDASTLAAGNYTLSGVVRVVSSYAYDNSTADNLVVAAGGPIEVTVLKQDINNDGIVDIADIYTAALAYGSTPGTDRWNPDCDINGDLIIDIEDIYNIALAFGKSL